MAPHVVGLLTSPATSLEDVIQLGIRKASSNKRMIAAQLAGQLAARARLRQVVGAGCLDGLITLSEATRRYVIRQGIPPDKWRHIAPGVDAEWLQFELRPVALDELRQAIGVNPGDWLVTYFGSPAPIRGTRVLLQAMDQLGAVHPQIKLLLLFRRWQDEWGREVARLRREVTSGNLHGRVHLIDGYLSQEQIMERLACSDLVCLPFEILPSDAPLSVTETMALGQAVITTNIACMPELVPEGCGWLAPPHAARPLAHGIESFMRAPELAHACGQRAHNFVAANRTWDGMGASLVAHLQQMQIGAHHGSNYHKH